MCFLAGVVYINSSFGMVSVATLALENRHWETQDKWLECHNDTMGHDRLDTKKINIRLKHIAWETKANHGPELYIVRGRHLVPFFAVGWGHSPEWLFCFSRSRVSTWCIYSAICARTGMFSDGGPNRRLKKGFCQWNMESFVWVAQTRPWQEFFHPLPIP